MTETEEIQKLQLSLCLLEKECPKCKGIGQYDAGDPAVKVFGLSDDCELCHGSGKIPLLDPELVREKCPCELVPCAECKAFAKSQYPTMPILEHPAFCYICQGRGWVPSRGPWQWFKAVYLLWANHTIDAVEFHHVRESAFFYQPELAFFRELAKTLGVKDA